MAKLLFFLTFTDFAEHCFSGIFNERCVWVIHHDWDTVSGKRKKDATVEFFNLICECVDAPRENSTHLYCMRVAADRSEMDISKPRRTNPELVNLLGKTAQEIFCVVCLWKGHIAFSPTCQEILNQNRLQHLHTS